MRTSMFIPLFLVALSLSGCIFSINGSSASKDSQTKESLRADTDLPHDQYLVGGGFHIKYVAPTSGLIVWANKANDQILLTQSLEAGETFEQSVNLDNDGWKQVIGDSPQHARLLLYFIPTSDLQRYRSFPGFEP